MIDIYYICRLLNFYYVTTNQTYVIDVAPKRVIKIYLYYRSNAFFFLTMGVFCLHIKKISKNKINLGITWHPFYSTSDFIIFLFKNKTYLVTLVNIFLWSIYFEVVVSAIKYIKKEVSNKQINEPMKERHRWKFPYTSLGSFTWILTTSLT